MYHFLLQPNIFNCPIRLTEDEQSDPSEIINRFFEDYSLGEVRHHLWSMVELCLTSDREQYGDPDDRANLLAFYSRSEGLIEAAFILMKEEKQEEM